MIDGPLARPVVVGSKDSYDNCGFLFKESNILVTLFKAIILMQEIKKKQKKPTKTKTPPPNPPNPHQTNNPLKHIEMSIKRNVCIHVLQTNFTL